jgi:hypothetical protein
MPPLLIIMDKVVLLGDAHLHYVYQKKKDKKTNNDLQNNT